MTRRKVPQMGWWMESYQKCSHTFVAKKRSELRGYCAKCGTDRSQVYHLPSPTPCGDEAEASAAITDDESEAHSMDTRERVARLLAECACMAYAWEDYLPRAAKICAIFAEEREALLARVEQAEEDSLLMQGCNDLVIRDRTEDQEKLAAVENREKKLLDALKDMRRWCLKRADDFSLLSVRRGIYAELAARLSIILSATDAALASAPVSWGVKITLIDPPAEGFSGGHDEPATPMDAAKEEKV